MTETQEHYIPDANDVLMGGGGYPSAKLDKLRVWVGGTIVAKPKSRQETEFGTGKPKTYPKSGDPIYGLLVDVQTDQRTDTEDDGIRRMYIEGRLLKEAVRNAVTNAGATGLEVGGKLFVAWTGEGVPPSAGASAPKLYDARYYPATTPVPASNGAAPMTEPMAEPGGAPAASQPPAQAPMSPPPVSSPAPAFADAQNAAQAPAPMPEPGAQAAAPVNAAPAGNDPTPEAIAALRAAGLDPVTVFPNYQD